MRCPECNTEFNLDEFPFGGIIQCACCKRHWETDYETDADDNLYALSIYREVKEE